MKAEKEVKTRELGGNKEHVNKINVLMVELDSSLTLWKDIWGVE